MSKSNIFFGLLILLSGVAPGQTIEQPNFGLKSHETLTIRKIELSSASSKFYMSIENRIPNGYFCADRKIALIGPDGSQSMLVQAEGIPVCPDEHKFSQPGEKLDFTLTFPPLKPGTPWVDIVEECSDNCFSFYGVTLDQELNRKIDNALVLADSGEPVRAMMDLISIVGTFAKPDPGIEGFLYVSIIKLARQTGNSVKASEWYNRLKASHAPRLQQYLKYLQDQGISY